MPTLRFPILQFLFINIHSFIKLWNGSHKTDFNLFNHSFLGKQLLPRRASTFSDWPQCRTCRSKWRSVCAARCPLCSHHHCKYWWEYDVWIFSLSLYFLMVKGLSIQDGSMWSYFCSRWLHCLFCFISILHMRQFSITYCTVQTSKTLEITSFLQIPP